jgi:hypothetical protein
MSKQAKEPPFANTRKALAEALSQIEGLLPGSIVVRHVRCGKAGCACKGDPPRLHGPYIQWTRTANSKTVTRLLSQEQLARYQLWFDNRKLLNDVVAKLEIASLNALDAAEGSTRSASRTRPAPTTRPRRAT